VCCVVQIDLRVAAQGVAQAGYWVIRARAAVSLHGCLHIRVGVVLLLVGTHSGLHGGDLFGGLMASQRLPGVVNTNNHCCGWRS
jgi:hypothetical protein